MKPEEVVTTELTGRYTVPKQTIVQRFQQFCGQTACARLTNSEVPFSGNGHTYATNGHLVVRTMGELCAPNPEAVKTCEEVINRANRDGEKVTVTMESVRGLLARCHDCSIRGTKEKRECPECHGEGIVTWDTGHHEYEADCLNCDGEGYFLMGKGKIARKDCPKCDGAGVLFGKVVQIGIAAVDPRYIARLVKAFGPLAFIAPATRGQACYFTFREGDGILMPMVLWRE
ncbi:MAG: hypothetical protein WC455_15120 [Dehalococcoidia bacterium]|jgi:Zn finger protein HypA/HybF involved in hydrogenase expression